MCIPVLDTRGVEGDISPVENDEVARVLQEIATLLSLKGENPFKIRAYERGAEVILGLDEDLATVIAKGRLRSIEGIGEALAEKIETLVKGGRVRLYDELKAEIPRGLVDLLRIPGVGPGRARALHEALGVDSIVALEAACRDGRVAAVKGFGARTAQGLLRSIERMTGGGGV
jgi:DNA polymerase (family X)